MPGAIYIDGGELKGGGRSSGNGGDGALGHGREHPWVFRVRRSAVSTLVGSGASCGGCGHGHAMAGGEKLSAAVDNLATARERRNREGETDGELT